MRSLLKGATVHLVDGTRKADVSVENSRIVAIADDLDGSQFDRVINLFGFHVFPGFVDVHVHLREPGFFYKETIRTGTMAAAHGGYTSVFAMPNLNPVPDCAAHLKAQTDIIEKDAVIRVYPYGAITKSQLGQGVLSDMAGMREAVKGYSDDGRGVQESGLMKSAMVKAKALNKIIVAHCEDNSELLPGGAIHEGAYSRAHGIVGINSKSEYLQLARDLDLVRETGCAYHVCHVSTKESVALIRQAKAKGLDVTAETAPHYLLLTQADLRDEGRFKMNPPLREEADRQALVEGIRDGTIDMIATDHAPHSEEEKAKGLRGSVMGIVGIETCFQLMVTHFVKTGIITMDRLLALLSYNPSKRFALPWGLAAGNPADLTVWDLEKEMMISAKDFLSLGKATPFEGEKVVGQCIGTMCDGRWVYEV